MSFSLQYPVPRDARMSQAFGKNPENYRPDFPGHEGIDWAIPVGTPICAAAEGQVSYIHYEPQPHPYGIHVRMRHAGSAYETIYAHLSQVLVKLNQTVPAGNVIALSGDTGRSTGPHLHFTLKKTGATASGETSYRCDVVDPLPYLQGAATNAPQPTPPEHTTLDVQVVSDIGLNLRTAPVVGDVIVRLPDKAILGSLEAAEMTRRKLGQPNQWLWVRAANGQVGYVAAWHVNVPGAPVAAQTGAPGGEAHRLQVNSQTEPLKLRQGPNTSQPILEHLPHTTLLESLEAPATTLEKVGKYGEWLQVRTLAGQTGYVAAWYLCLSLEGLEASLDPGSLSFGLGAQPEELRSLDTDALERIKGIGPKIAALLTAVGICTFKQIAALTPEQLKAVLAEGGISSAYVATWPEQAREILGELE